LLVSTSPTFDKIKSEIVKATTLMCFDENQPVQIQTDASRSGLACCLMQARKPIAHASRALPDKEKNYATIELEALAIVYACKKFHLLSLRERPNNCPNIPQTFGLYFQ